MAEKVKTRGTIDLDLRNSGDITKIAIICEALGSETRLNILKKLQNPPYVYTITELIKITDIPCTTLLHHLGILEKAGIIRITYKSSSHGNARLVQRSMRGLNLRFYYSAGSNRKENIKQDIQTMKIGNFVKFSGNDFNFATKDVHYQKLGTNCYVSQRFDALLIYTLNGMITYYFSNIIAKTHTISELSISLELSSEAPYYDNDYLSDITFYINQIEVGTYTSQGDYGDRKGLLNPSWWPSTNSQYGKLVTLKVDENGSYLNGNKIDNDTTIKKFHLEIDNKIEFSFGNKLTSKNIGGFNLFGSRFGDYPQDIILILSYKD
jgi:predicted transcriptional regulator